MTTIGYELGVIWEMSVKFIPKRCEPEQHLIFRKYIAVLHKPESE